jgi:glycosyltransferase involved in cell wall biosynthesis
MAERRQLRRAVGAHVFFEEEADNVRALEPAARTIVVPTGFEIAADGWVGGKYLAWLGRYSLRGKGLDILLEAVASFAPEERPPVILRGIDYLDGRREVAAEVERLGLNDVVQVLGPVYGDEKVEFLRHSRAFVHPSRYDAHSIALLENLALGAPCIVSSAMLSSGLLGSRGAALVTDLSSSLLAECIRQVDAAAPTLSQNARSLVADEFSWASAGKRYFASLRSILGGA